MNLWFVRMARWVRKPPSSAQIKVVGAVILLCAVLYGIEQIWGWPEALTPERVPRGGVPR